MKIATTLLFLTSVFALFVYSFSQIDLNLTLSNNTGYQLFQQKLIELGYFNRPLSTIIFTTLTVLLTISYLSFLYLAANKKISVQFVLFLSLITAVLLLFSYPAFSYDIYNYIFDARILVNHHANPYTHTALMFPDDLWTRFMRWTHRTYPYGPTWLLLSSVIYTLGLNKFTLTLLLFKSLGFLSYLLSAFSIVKIAKHLKLQNPQFHLVFFLLNPLIIIEILVTSHLDAAMAAFMLLGIYFFTVGKKISSWFSLLFSAGIKYTSLSLLPFWMIFQNGFLSFNKTIFISFISSLFLTGYIITQREILPWYFITPFALLSLLKPNKLSVLFVTTITLSTLLRYAPFIYDGTYSPWVYQFRDQITYLSLFISLAAFFLIKFITKKAHE